MVPSLRERSYMFLRRKREGESSDGLAFKKLPAALQFHLHHLPFAFKYPFYEMSSLADELAADLDFSDEEQKSIHSENEEKQEDQDIHMAEAGLTEESVDRSKSAASSDDSIHAVATFLHSKETQDILKVRVIIYC